MTAITEHYTVPWATFTSRQDSLTFFSATHWLTVSDNPHSDQALDTHGQARSGPVPVTVPVAVPVDSDSDSEWHCSIMIMLRLELTFFFKESPSFWTVFKGLSSFLNKGMVEFQGSLRIMTHFLYNSHNLLVESCWQRRRHWKQTSPALNSQTASSLFGCCETQQWLWKIPKIETE